MSDKITDDSEISRKLEDDERILAALQKAVSEAIRRHKLAGNPICYDDNGEVVWVKPADIKLL